MQKSHNRAITWFVAVCQMVCICLCVYVCACVSLEFVYSTFKLKSVTQHFTEAQQSALGNLNGEQLAALLMFRLVGCKWLTSFPLKIPWKPSLCHQQSNLCLEPWDSRWHPFIEDSKSLICEGLREHSKGIASSSNIINMIPTFDKLEIRAVIKEGCVKCQIQNGCPSS